MSPKNNINHHLSGMLFFFFLTHFHSESGPSLPSCLTCFPQLCHLLVEWLFEPHPRLDSHSKSPFISLILSLAAARICSLFLHQRIEISAAGLLDFFRCSICLL